MLFSVFLLFWAPWGKTPDSCYLHSFPRKCLWNDLDVLTVLSRCFPGPSPEQYISKVACVLAASTLIAHHRQQRGFKMLPKCQQNKLHADEIELNLMLQLTPHGWLIKVWDLISSSQCGSLILKQSPLPEKKCQIFIQDRCETVCYCFISVPFR